MAEVYNKISILFFGLTLNWQVLNKWSVKLLKSSVLNSVIQQAQQNCS